MGQYFTNDRFKCVKEPISYCRRVLYVYKDILPSLNGNCWDTCPPLKLVYCGPSPFDFSGKMSILVQIEMNTCSTAQTIIATHCPMSVDCWIVLVRLDRRWNNDTSPTSRFRPASPYPYFFIKRVDFVAETVLRPAKEIPTPLYAYPPRLTPPQLIFGCLTIPK